MNPKPDRLEVGGPIQLFMSDDVIFGIVTSISRGKKGVQVSIKTESGSVTKHIPHKLMRDWSVE